MKKYISKKLLIIVIILLLITSTAIIVLLLNKEDKTDPRITNLKFDYTKEFAEIDCKNCGSDENKINTTIFYPDFDALEITESIPVVIFMHGFSAKGEYYSWLASKIALEGYIVILPNRAGQFDIDLDEAKVIISESLNYLEKQNQLQDSALYRKIDTERICLAGHSMGAATSLLIVSDTNLSIDTVIAISPGTIDLSEDTIPIETESAKEAIRHAEMLPDALTEIQVPVLYIIGDKDKITPIDAVRGYYQDTRSSKSLLTIQSGNHTNFVDGGSIAGSFMGMMESSEIDAELQKSITEEYFIKWLDIWLRDKQELLTDFEIEDEQYYIEYQE